MRAEAVCGGQAGMKIAIRMDDITPDMNWDNFLALKALFDRYHICPLIGVVPDNRDDGLRIMEPREDFWEYLKELQGEGGMIAQHGCYHQYTTRKGGLFPLNCFSEYAGVPLEQQRSMISCGKKKLEERGIYTDIFMAPGHTFDKNTLKALKECGFSFLTDGFGKKPYCREGLTFLPVSSRKKDCFRGKQGYTTLVIHANGMNASEIGWYERMLAEYPEKFISYKEFMEIPGEKRGFAGNLAEYLQASAKRILVKLIGLRHGNGGNGR